MNKYLTGGKRSWSEERSVGGVEGGGEGGVVEGGEGEEVEGGGGVRAVLQPPRLPLLHLLLHLHQLLVKAKNIPCAWGLPYLLPGGESAPHTAELVLQPQLHLLPAAPPLEDGVEI